MSDGKFALQIGKFQFSKDEVDQMRIDWGLDTDELLRRMVKDVQPRARVPVSHFRVGAAGLNWDGEVFLGVNVEFVDASFAQTIHAEQFLVTLSRARAASPLVKIAVSDSPCGHCRQFMTEFAHDGKLEVLIGDQPVTTLNALLPQAFTPMDLKVEERFYSQALNIDKDGTIEEAARRAALNSYIPYSRTRAGTAIRSVDGELFAGSALENCAFNPALPPFQAAIVAAYAGGCPPEEIREVVLCQDKGGQIDYEPQLRDLTTALSSEPVSFKTIYL